MTMEYMKKKMVIRPNHKTLSQTVIIKDNTIANKCKKTPNVIIDDNSENISG